MARIANRKRLSLKGLADYMTASHVKQRSILRSYKYPDEDESQAKILYYREARERIVAYHKSAHPAAWLHSHALQLESLAVLSTPPAARRLSHNARALASYAQYFGGRVFTVLDDLHMTLAMGGIEISVRPDMHVMEKKGEKLVKLEFAAEPPNSDAVKIVTQTMFEATRSANLAIGPRDILYLDVTRGKQHPGAKMGSAIRREIEAACLSIANIWDGI